jgi:hypothetical protein
MTRPQSVIIRARCGECHEDAIHACCELEDGTLAFACGSCGAVTVMRAVDGEDRPVALSEALVSGLR